MLEVLRRVLPPGGRALEIASGTGQHVAWFARHLPAWHWQPTEFDASMLPSIAAWCDGDDGKEGEPALTNVAAPRVLDVLQPVWDLPAPARFDAVVCANMLHIAPWPACGAFMRGVARHLAPQGRLVLYGPYLEGEVPTAASNLEFDAFLRRRDPASGLRTREAVQAQALAAGLALLERVEMPANNLMLVFAPVPTPVPNPGLLP